MRGMRKSRPDPSRQMRYWELAKRFRAAGYSLVTTLGLPTPASLIEVYPPVAMLGLLQGPRQIPYKTINARASWPDQSLRARRRLLVEQWRAILQRLEHYASGVDFPLPVAPE